MSRSTILAAVVVTALFGCGATESDTLPAAPPAADTSAPSAPTGISATATSASAITVTWSAASDDTGVAGYRVYRCAGSACSPNGQVATASSTTFADSSLTASTAYTYRVAAVDGAGNASPTSPSATAVTLAADVPPPAPPPAPVGGVDFNARCAAAGVVLCQGFDDASRFGAAVYPGTGLYPAGDGRILGSQDTAIKTSGTGALKLTGSASGANTAGQWVQDIGTTFGQNTTFYVQYRYRLTREMMTGTGGGRKLAIFHYAFKSCADLEITTQNTFYRGFPQMYTDCGAQGADRTVGGTIYLQQGSDPFPNGDGWNCPYGGINASRCALFQPDQWMTLYYRIDIGTWGTANSRIQAWVAYDGQPLKQFINMPNYRINNAGPVVPGIDHITLTPYDTGATSAPNGSVWYDELIVSRSPIAPPTGVSSGTSPQ